MDLMAFNWLFWIGGFFLSYELAAVVFGWRTLTGQTQNWFSLGGQKKRHWIARRAVFAVFWVLLGVHFFFGVSAVWSVIAPGVPFAAVIVLSTFVWKDATTQSNPQTRKEIIMDWLKKVLGGLKKAGGWVLRRGPLWSSLLVGASVVVPGAAPMFKIAASLIAGASGGAVDQDVVKTFAEVLSGGLLLIGAIRKFWSIISVRA